MGMFMIIGSVLFSLGVTIALLVNGLCMECNSHQLWKGKVEHYLVLLDRAGLAGVVLGIICFVLGYVYWV